MKTEVITVRAVDPIVEALKLLVLTEVGRLLVVDEAGELAGIITKGDINTGTLEGTTKGLPSRGCQALSSQPPFIKTLSQIAPV